LALLSPATIVPVAPLPPDAARSRRDDVGLDVGVGGIGRVAGVITPSKKDPAELLLLSPPTPRMIAPSWCMGM
jgi:hypothetical protein